MNQLHILNGSEMLSHFQINYPDKTKIYTSFNEAMCWGDVSEDIFSKEFIRLRSRSLNTIADEYKKTVIVPLSSLFSKDELVITLWFDSDMFCQINLLTLLAYLNQIQYQHDVQINLVDYQYEILKTYFLNPKNYKEIYKEVLINKSIPEYPILPIMQTGIKLYLHLQKENNEIVSFISDHIDLSTSDLLDLLLLNFQHYGLGDIQYLQLIEKTRLNFR